jgi:hypothetical protein
MKNDYFNHPQRFPKNVDGAFYTLGCVGKDGVWCGDCLSCGSPEIEAPTLLAPLTDENSDTFFIRQPETEEEIEQACCAIDVCCTGALRYGGKDTQILLRLSRTHCDYADLPSKLQPPQSSNAKKWWRFW